MRGAAIGAVFFLILGTLFGYYILVPLSLQFFAGFQLAPDIENQFDLSKYFGMITLWSLGTGALFELPVVVFALARLGVVTAATLRKGRRLAIVIILIVAAFLTPPDPFSQVAVSIPLYILYELSVLLAARVEKTRLREQAERDAEDEQRPEGGDGSPPEGPVMTGPPLATAPPTGYRRPPGYGAPYAYGPPPGAPVPYGAPAARLWPPAYGPPYSPPPVTPAPPSDMPAIRHAA